MEEELSIGDVEGKEEQMFKNIFDVAVDENENIYILDLNQRQIRVFDKKGKYLRNVGKLGQGPGEFQYPRQIIISPNQEFVICDPIVRRLFFFSLDGVFRKDTPTWTKGRLLRVMLDSKGKIIGEVPLVGEKQGFSLRKFGPDFEELYTIATREREKIPILESLAPSIVWCLSESDEIIWGDSEKYEINIQDRNGNLVKKIIKEYEPVRVIEEEHNEQIKRKFGGRPIPPEFEQELPKYYPTFKTFMVDYDGRLFSSTFEKSKSGEGYYCDVFNSEGKYIVKIPFKTQPRVWKNQKLYTIEEDEEGYQYVKRYKVTWKF
ncbi:MAG: 6-bladed beta-propeller [Nitrospirota bacterium]|nr:6-bladed beta-propeller [Nitrospirota bacterium]